MFLEVFLEHWQHSEGPMLFMEEPPKTTCTVQPHAGGNICGPQGFFSKSPNISSPPGDSYHMSVTNSALPLHARLGAAEVRCLPQRGGTASHPSEKRGWKWSGGS